MRLRGLLIGVFGTVLVAGAAVSMAPLLSQRLAGSIEDRLARETGLTWRIGGLDLDPAPGLVLRDVTLEGGGVSGRLRRVRATGPVGLLFGSGGTVQATIEGARVTLPQSLALPRSLASPDARRGRDGPEKDGDAIGVSALRAVLRGTAAAIDEAGRSVSLAAAGADLALDLAAGPAGRDPSIRLDLPDRAASVEVEAAPAGSQRGVRATWVPEGGPRVAASASARADGAAVRLDGIAGTIDRAPFAGSLSAEGIGPSAGATAKPRLTLDLRLDALALTEGTADLRADPVAGLTVPVRADLVPDPAWFSAFDGQATVAVQRLAVGPLRAAAVAVSARVKEGRLDAALDSATLYGGSARGRYVLEPEGGTGRHQIGLSLADVRVLPLLRDVAGVQGLDGTGGARLDVQARGGTTQALLRSAAGQVTVSAVDGRIDGLDLARAAGLTNLGGGLATRLDRLGARFVLADGRAATDDLTLATGLIAAEGGGEIDLTARTLDLRLKPLKVTAGSGGRLNVPIRIAGPWDAPAVTADLAGLAQDPAGALQGLQNLGSSILGGGNGGGAGAGRGGLDLGEGLGGLLDGLMPRQDRAPRRRP